VVSPTKFQLLGKYPVNNILMYFAFPLLSHSHLHNLTALFKLVKLSLHVCAAQIPVLKVYGPKQISCRSACVFLL